MKAGVLDANVLLRFFLRDNPKQSAAAVSLFRKAEEDEAELYLPDARFAEALPQLDDAPSLHRRNDSTGNSGWRRHGFSATTLPSRQM